MAGLNAYRDRASTKLSIELEMESCAVYEATLHGVNGFVPQHYKELITVPFYHEPYTEQTGNVAWVPPGDILLLP